MSAVHGYTLFDTLIGRCGIAWGERGVVGVLLPDTNERATRVRVRRRFPEADEAAPPAAVQAAIDGIVAMLRGDTGAGSDGVALDMASVPPFARRVYQAARAIPPGATLSYGELATRLGAPGAARAVGQALGKNPFAIVVPCHRVLGAGGRVGGFSASGGVTTKLRLLALERRREAGGGLGFDAAAALAHLRAADPQLGRLIDEVGAFGMRVDPISSTFLTLAQAIVYQQLHGRAAATIFARLRALFPNAKDGPTPQQLLRAPEAKLRGAGLSANKLLALRDLASKTIDGVVPAVEALAAMDDEAIIARLTEVRGIGRWTVEMLLMFRLGRPDVLPVDDFGVRKGFSVAFRKRTMPAPADLSARGERWRPYRTAASWYLWRAAERAPK